ncbi:MAG: hypothetical protein E6J90_28435 [Deltaproteobacteria bacterium]|nr:MAG: hypothetical protein E6J90_28435 [Deltaproteobacteria bacterium]
MAAHGNTLASPRADLRGTAAPFRMWSEDGDERADAAALRPREIVLRFITAIVLIALQLVIAGAWLVVINR